VAESSLHAASRQIEPIIPAVHFNAKPIAHSFKLQGLLPEAKIQHLCNRQKIDSATGYVSIIPVTQQFACQTATWME
jgi:hypothetical protein